MLLHLFFFWFVGHTAQYTMPVQLQNLQTASGQVLVAVYNKSDGFMDLKKAVFKQNYPVKAKGSLSVDIPNLPEGNYAVSCYHDVNNNGVLDKNLLGIPTEPYGFSQNARPKFRAPTWDESNTYFKGQRIDIKLETW